MVLILIASALVAMLITRDDVDITILRTQGMIYQALPDGYTGNLYTARMFNKTHEDIVLGMNTASGQGEIQILGKQPVVKKESYAIITFLIKKKTNTIDKRKTDINIDFYVDDKKITTKKTTFIGPMGL